MRRVNAVPRLMLARSSRSLVLGSLLMLAGVLASVVGLSEQDGVETALRHQRDLTFLVEHLITHLEGVEGSQRGFLLTGIDTYLAPYDRARAAVAADLDQLERLGLDLHDLPARARARLDAAASGIAIRRAEGLEGAAAHVRLGQGFAAMAACRDSAARIEADAEATMTTLHRRDDLSRLLSQGLATIAVLAGCACLAAFALQRRREHRAIADRLAAVTQNAPVGLGLLDSDHRLIHANEALARFAGVPQSDAAGRRLWDLLPGLRVHLEPMLHDVATGAAPVRNRPVVVDPDGDSPRRDIEIGAWRLGPAAEDGTVVAVSDITASSLAARELGRSEARFRTLAEASTSIIWVTSPEGALAETAAWGRFTGQTHDEAVGNGWTDALHEECREEAFVVWQRAVATVSLYRVEQRVRRADGAWRIFDVCGVPVLDERGRIREWVGTHVDITERREAELALVAARDRADAANRAKSTFLANMSHELRTPLSAVIGYAEMLEEEAEDSGLHRLLDDLRKIQGNARHLLSLINDVLDLSKIEANRMTSFAETFDVESLLREAAATVDALVAKNANTFVLELAPGLGEMHTDIVKLRQCLFNLISNASKFTESGTVRLIAAREGDTLQFDVADTGIGMSDEQLGRLFERFTQADEGTTREYGGTGLGLALTRAFCRLLGGDITVRSALGEGTTFTIRLPARLPSAALEPEPDAEILPPDPPAATAGSPGNLILVVDDDAAQRELMTRYLERAGFSVRTAIDGEAGLRLAREFRPEAILLDVMMPKIDGWEVLRRLKADPELGEIPVVLASFVNEPVFGRSLGAVDYILKPVDRPTLESVMDRFRDHSGVGDVLIVDDDADARTRLRTVLERAGWSVAEAADGRQALDACARATPKLILLDLNMPVMDGFTFLHALRERPEGAQVPVVVLSARELDGPDRDQLASAADILRKDEFSIRDLPARLRRITS